VIRALLLALVLEVLAATGTLGAAGAGGGRDEASQLVFLLQYIGTDYPSAVREGRVVDEFEYREMQEFAAASLERFRRLASYLSREPEREIREILEELEADIEARRPEAVIRRRTDRAVELLAANFDLDRAPAVLPRPDRAASLYRENCADCHGEAGRGDGPRAKELDPRPAAFTDRQRMDSVSPFVFYNAITHGVPGTAMASFREALSEQQRWELAFFLWTFVAPPEPPWRGELPTVPLRDLATLSSEELAPRLVAEVLHRGRRLEERQARDLVALLRARPQLAESLTDKLQRVRDRLARGVASIESGEFDEGAEIVTDAYLAEFEPLEPALDAIRPDLRRRFEEELVAFHRARRTRDVGEARERALRLLAVVRELEDATRAGPSRMATFVLIGGFALVLAVGLAAIRLRRG
jgi:high-affinity iron transporter